MSWSTQMRRLELGAACAAVVFLSACGGGRAHAVPPPTLPRPVAQALAARTDAVSTALAAGDSCGAAALARRLQKDMIAAINSGRVATALQEPLSGAVNDLAGRVVCVPPPITPNKEDGHGKYKGHDKHNEGD